MVMTSETLREMLFRTLEDLRDDKCSPQKAQAIGKLAAQIVNSVSVEIEYFKNIRKYESAESGEPNLVIRLTSNDSQKSLTN